MTSAHFTWAAVAIVLCGCPAGASPEASEPVSKTAVDREARALGRLPPFVAPPHQFGEFVHAHDPGEMAGFDLVGVPKQVITTHPPQAVPGNTADARPQGPQVATVQFDRKGWLRSRKGTRPMDEGKVMRDEGQYVYDENGRLIERRESTDGKLTYGFSYSYDADGRVVRFDWDTPALQGVGAATGVKGHQLFEYTSANEVASTQVVPGQPETRIEIELDAKGRLKQGTASTGEVEEYRYDSRGRITQHIQNAKGKTRSTTSTYEEDASTVTRTTLETTTKASGVEEIGTRRVETQDARGNTLRTEFQYSPEHSSSEVRVCEYELDTTGNWTKSTCTYASTLRPVVVERVITYWD